MNKPINKVTLKLSHRIRKALDAACTQASILPVFDQFSYQVDWSNFPNSLMINCHLHTLQTEESAHLAQQLSKILQLSLLKQGIKFRDIRKNIKFILASNSPL
jgi:hypothetical protein